MLRNRVAVHISFWLLFILTGVFVNVSVHNNAHVTWALYWQDLTHPFTFIGYSRSIFTCYVTLWVFGKLLYSKRYFAAVAAVLVLIVADVFLRYAIEQLFIGPVFNLWQYYKEITIGEYFNENVLYSAMGIFICFFLKIIDDLFRNEQARREQLNMELQFLKSQVNPHFLFNTFNNLYGLSLSEPQKTPDAIVKLSAMMRYMLYDSNSSEVPLTGEIAHLQNMIDLHKLRYEENTFIQFNVNGNAAAQVIAPCLLVPFVENGFKHGQLHDAANPFTINLVLQHNELYLHAKNKIHRNNKDEVGGIGLKNVQRRLHLLYGKNHTLEIKNVGEVFEVELYITLH